MDINAQIEQLEREQETDAARWEALPATGLQRGYLSLDMAVRAEEIKTLKKEKAMIGVFIFQPEDVTA